MNAQQLRNSILQEAIEGRLVPQDPNDEPASVLLERIREEKKRLFKEGKLKKKDLEEKPINDDEKPFEIPDSWEWCRIKDLFETSSGSTPQSKNPKYYSNGSINWVRTTDLNNGVLDSCEIKVTKEAVADYNLSIIPQDSVCIAMYGGGGTIGKHSIIKFDTTINQSVCAIFPNGYCDMNFVHVFMQYQRPYWMDYAAGSRKDPNINQVIIKNCLFPLPPLAEQKRIVAKIEELLPKVEEYGKAQDALNKLNEELPEKLKKSVLQEAIEGRLVPQDPNDDPASVLLNRIREEKKRLVKEGKLKKKDLEETPISEDEKPFDIPDSWEWVRLSGIALDSADGPFGSNLKSEHYTNRKEVRIIQLSNIGELGWKDTNSKYTTYEHLETISRSEAYPGDVIIAKMMPAGRAIICPSDDPKYVLSSDAVRFNFDKRINRKFLYYAINSPVFINQVYSEVQGITRVRTSLTKLRYYLIPLPPLAEQKRIVAKIEQLFGEIDKLKK